MDRLSLLQSAVAYIEAHLADPVGLEEVARETGYSYAYMTRLFAAVLGEPAGRYIHRRRLYTACEQLLYTRRRVTDVALDCGFASPEAFSRAFKTAFGCSPVDYRKTGLDLVVRAKKGLSPQDVSHIAHNISHRPQILYLHEIKVAGIRGNTSLSDNRLPGLWNRFLHHYGAFASGGVGVGICETQTAYTPGGDVSFSAVVGCPVTSFDGLPQGLVHKTLGAGRYAVFTHRGTFANLFKTYQYIFGTWLPLSKETLDQREDFEVYAHPVRSFDDPCNKVHILIPIR